MPTAQPDELALEINSWGHVVEAWQIDAQGRGSYRERVKSTNDPWATATRPVDLGPDGFAKLIELAKPAAAFAGRKLPGEKTVFDLPYGTMSWRRGGVTTAVSFDFGSSLDTAAARAAGTAILAANDEVKHHAAASVRPGGSDVPPTH